MKKISVLMIAIIALSISISVAYGQAAPPPDSDGDGVADTADSCAREPGPASNAGCPVDDTNDTTTNNPDDRDGDGTNDVSDNCPDSGGPSSNAGCPIDDTTTTQPEPTAEPDSTTSTNPLRPDPNGACQLTTVLSSRVNIRLEPSDSSEIVGQLSPDTLVDVLGTVIVNGTTWYRVLNGWVFEDVVVVGGNCPINITGESTSIGTATPDGSTNGLVPETRCTALPNGELVCHTILTAVPNDGATNGLVPSEKCVSLPSGENVCYQILLGIAPQTGADAGLVPQTECTTLLGSVPICFNILVGVAPEVLAQTREHVLLAGYAPTPSTAISQQCTMLATGEEFCYNTFSTVLPDGATNGLQPETKCVDTLEGTPACFTILVARPADDGSTSGLVPQTQCTDLLGELICINSLTAVPDDGSTSGLVPQTQCVDLLGETICIQNLTAVPDDGATDGLVPQIKCVDLLGETICIQNLTAVPNDGATDGLVPQTQCVDLLGETICIDSFTAVAPENDFYQWGLLSLETETDTGTPIMLNFINQADINPEDDGSTEQLVPGLKCVDTPGGTPFCYPILIAVAPSADNATGGLSPESSCTRLEDGSVTCSLELVAYAEDPSGNMGLVPHTTCIGFFDETICFEVLSAVPEDGEAGLQGIIFGGDGRTGFTMPLPDIDTAAIAIPAFIKFSAYAPTQQTSSICIMFEEADLAYCPE